MVLHGTVFIGFSIVYSRWRLGDKEDERNTLRVVRIIIYANPWQFIDPRPAEMWTEEKSEKRVWAEFQTGPCILHSYRRISL